MFREGRGSSPLDPSLLARASQDLPAPHLPGWAVGGEGGSGLGEAPERPSVPGVCECLSGWGPRPGSRCIPSPAPPWPPEQHVLEALEKQAVLVYTPSRKVNGKRVVCYDDRYIVKVAYELDGVIVSNDNYRDLQSENPEWKWFIEQRLLMFSFVNDRYVAARGVLARVGGGWGDRQKATPTSLSPGRGRACSHGHPTSKQRAPSPGDGAHRESPTLPPGPHNLSLSLWVSLS